MNKNCELIIIACCPVKLGNVSFWVDNEGPFSGRLSYDVPIDNWLTDKILEDLHGLVGGVRMIYVTRDGENAVALGWGEFCDLRRDGWSSTDANNAIAEALMTEPQRHEGTINHAE